MLKGLFDQKAVSVGLAACFILGCARPATDAPSADVTQGKEEDGTVTEDVVYGEDGRRDTYEITDASVLEKAASSVALIKSASLVAAASGRMKVRGDVYGPSQNLCRDEKFYSQEAGAFCSGSLVGADLILTAGHCIRTQADCRETRFVFDYAVLNGRQTSVEVEAANVYACAEIVHTEVLSSGSDYAVVRLNRPVIGGRAPLSVRRSGGVSVGDDVYVIGHPSGLPQKITLGGKVRSLQREHFITNLDTYGGNSGSPVFNARTGDIEGILVRGENDFVQRGSCVASNHCADGACRGEDVTFIARALAHIDSDSGSGEPTPTPTPVPVPSGRIEGANSSEVAIPDNDSRGIVSEITMAEGVRARRIRVAVDIEHTYRGDLQVSLIAPDGRSVMLHDRDGSSADNLRGTYGADLRAKGDLASIADIAVGGAWKLKVVDLARADRGRLKQWRLVFE